MTNLWLGYFSGALLQEGSGSEFTWGLSPLSVIVIFLLVVLVIWLALRSQSGREDLYEPVHDDDHHHDDHDGHHHDEAHAEEAEPETAAPAEAPAADEAEVVVDDAKGEPDDLTKIEGIGPKVSMVLINAGITTYSQLAGAEQEALKAALETAGYQYMDPASWPEQARLAAAGEWDALAAFQDDLKGGR